MRTFADLVRLADTKPSDYFAEVDKMKLQDPERYAQFIEHLRKNLSKLSERERRCSSVTSLLSGDVKALEIKRRAGR